MVVLDKGAYQLSLDGKKIKITVNSNLLKLCYNRLDYKLIIIVKHKNL